MKSFLCVCFGNSCRSPMMQALLAERLAYKNIEADVVSAGIAEKEESEASTNAKIIMREFGLSIDDHRSRHINSLDLQSFDSILVVDEKIKKAIVNAGAEPSKIIILNEENGGIPNPYGGDLNIYKNCAQVIKTAIEKITL